MPVQRLIFGYKLLILLPQSLQVFATNQIYFLWKATKIARSSTERAPERPKNDYYRREIKLWRPVAIILRKDLRQKPTIRGRCGILTVAAPSSHSQDMVRQEEIIKISSVSSIRNMRYVTLLARSVHTRNSLSAVWPMMNYAEDLRNKTAVQTQKTIDWWYRDGGL